MSESAKRSASAPEIQSTQSCSRAETCRTCAAWDQKKILQNGNSYMGHCRAPLPIYVPREGGCWPTTEDIDWCSHWRPRAAPAGQGGQGRAGHIGYDTGNGGVSEDFGTPSEMTAAEEAVAMLTNVEDYPQAAPKKPLRAQDTDDFFSQAELDSLLSGVISAPKDDLAAENARLIGRIAELESQRRNWLDTDLTASALVGQEKEISTLTAALEKVREKVELIVEEGIGQARDDAREALAIIDEALK